MAHRGIWVKTAAGSYEVRGKCLGIVGYGRVGREVARQHLRYLETVAVNCDVRVQDNEEFDRRVYLRPDTGAEGDTHGSPVAGHQLAKAAEIIPAGKSDRSVPAIRSHSANKPIQRAIADRIWIALGFIEHMVDQFP
jgi:hypothetical protein